MRSIDLLRVQHGSLETLLAAALTAKGSERIRVLGELAEQLTLHCALEEEHFCPALQSNGLEGPASRVLEEHEQIRTLVADILELKRNDPKLESKIAQLARAARAHLAAEEQTVFPAVEAAFSGEQLEAMGQAMHQMADRLRGAELLKLAGEREPARA